MALTQVPSAMLSDGALTAATSQNTTSGTSIDFTNIPSWTKRITIMLNGVSLSGTALFRLQIGPSGGVETTGYNGTSSYNGSANGSASFSNGFDSNGDNNASVVRYGTLVLTNLSGNIWCLSGQYAVTTPSVYNMIFAGTKSLASTLSIVRLTSSNGTDTFDAGSANIFYE